jgi:hypothetical protein
MGRKYTLLRSQRKQVFEILHEVGLELADFSWSEREEAGAYCLSRLDYRGGPYSFQFSWYELNSWCILCPGRYRSMEYEHPMNWKEQEASFRAWAQCLKREIESPDPWAEMAKYKISLHGEPSEAMLNEPISAYEADHIGERLLQLAERIEQELRLSEKEATLVRGRLGYLAEAARRQKSRDWLYTALGVCITSPWGWNWTTTPCECCGSRSVVSSAALFVFPPSARTHF